ncbi:hypothetical protein [Streptomyces sp. NPDC002133]|uniref:hypothetical protein n=1 Tax=Streptomyces sp. NPDC002133 TaxID=3154409 RepID=UPI00332AAFDD
MSGPTGVAAPTGMGERVPGGWRVSGRWAYNSGAPYATWAAVGALLKDERGSVTDQALVLIPASGLSVEDTWRTAGMRGTAGNTLIGQNVFVPEHRVLSVPAAAEGVYPRSDRDEALYGAAFGPMLLLCLVGPLLGLGKAATVAEAYEEVESGSAAVKIVVDARSDPPPPLPPRPPLRAPHPSAARVAAGRTWPVQGRWTASSGAAGARSGENVTNVQPCSCSVSMMPGTAGTVPA